MDLKVYALLNAKIKELTGESIDLSKYYTKEEADAAITAKVAEIVADAPEDFDTLKEMSDWISTHENSAAEMNSAIQTNANDISALNTNKVDKVAGKSLISDTEIERLANVDNYDDTGVKADINANKTNISTLKKHVTGELTDSDFAEDSTVAMTKNVPTGISNYAAVKMIGGKTVKGNLFDFSSGTTSTTHKGITFTNNKDGSFTVSGTSSAGDAYIELNSASSPMPNLIKAGGSYYISNKSSSGNVKINLVPYNGSGYESTLSGGNTPTLVTIPSNTVGLIIRIAVSTIGTTVNETVYPMISEYTNSYVPYGTLSNAPVESVVSVGKNRIEKTIRNVNITTAGVLESNGGYDMYFARVEKGKNYTFNSPLPVVSGFYASEPKVGDTTYNGVRIAYETAGSVPVYITAPITGWMCLRTATNYSGEIAIFEGTTKQAYTPPHKTTLLIPDSDRNLPCFGYGIDETLQNIRDYENGTYTQMVAEVDLGDLSWTYNADHTYFECTAPSNLKVPSSNTNVANIVCSIYKTIANLQYNNSENKTISISIGGKIGVCDTSYTDATTFKTAMKGVKLVYELATPVVTDCSDILHPIRVETGGTITFNNEHNLDMPNTVVYKKEVSLS